MSHVSCKKQTLSILQTSQTNALQRREVSHCILFQSTASDLSLMVQAGIDTGENSKDAGEKHLCQNQKEQDKE